MTHELKCLSIYFNEVVKGTKTFEIRKNDRSYQVGDLLLLMEIDDAENDPVANNVNYTGQTHLVEVTYILKTFAGMSMGDYVIMSIRKPKSLIS